MVDNSACVVLEWLLQWACKMKQHNAVQAIKEKMASLQLVHTTESRLRESSATFHSMVTNKEAGLYDTSISIVEAIFAAAPAVHFNTTKFANLSMALRIKYMLHQLKIDPANALPKLSVYFPRSIGDMFDYLPPRVRKRVSENMSKFRKFYLSLLMSETQRAQFFESGYEADFGSEYETGLCDYCLWFCNAVDACLLPTKIEQILGHDVTTDDSTDHGVAMEILLDFCHDKHSLTGADVVELVDLLCPRARSHDPLDLSISEDSVESDLVSPPNDASVIDNQQGADSRVVSPSILIPVSSQNNASVSAQNDVIDLTCQPNSNLGNKSDNEDNFNNCQPDSIYKANNDSTLSNIRKSHHVSKSTSVLKPDESFILVDDISMVVNTSYPDHPENVSKPDNYKPDNHQPDNPKPNNSQPDDESHQDDTVSSSYDSQQQEKSPESGLHEKSPERNLDEHIIEQSDDEVDLVEDERSNDGNNARSSVVMDMYGLDVVRSPGIASTSHCDNIVRSPDTGSSKQCIVKPAGVSNIMKTTHCAAKQNVIVSNVTTTQVNEPQSTNSLSVKRTVKRKPADNLDKSLKVKKSRKDDYDDSLQDSSLCYKSVSDRLNYSPVGSGIVEGREFGGNDLFMTGCMGSQNCGDNRDYNDVDSDNQCDITTTGSDKYRVDNLHDSHNVDQVTFASGGDNSRVNRFGDSTEADNVSECDDNRRVDNLYDSDNAHDNDVIRHGDNVDDNVISSSGDMCTVDNLYNSDNVHCDNSNVDVRDNENDIVIVDRCYNNDNTDDDDMIIDDTDDVVITRDNSKSETQDHLFKTDTCSTSDLPKIHKKSPLNDSRIRKVFVDALEQSTYNNDDNTSDISDCDIPDNVGDNIADDMFDVSDNGDNDTLENSAEQSSVMIVDNVIVLDSEDEVDNSQDGQDLVECRSDDSFVTCNQSMLDRSRDMLECEASGSVFLTCGTAASCYEEPMSDNDSLSDASISDPPLRVELSTTDSSLSQSQMIARHHTPHVKPCLVMLQRDKNLDQRRWVKHKVLTLYS